MDGMDEPKERIETTKVTDWDEVDRIILSMKDKSVYEVMLALQGKVHLNIDLEALREDRD